MEKINIFIKKYGAMIIVLLFIFFYYAKYGTIKETMICDLERPYNNYFFKNQQHLIEDYNFREKELTLLKTLFDKNTFLKNGYDSDNKSLSEFLKLNNIDGKKDDFIEAVNKLLDDNRYFDNKNNYDISLDSKLSQIRHIWLRDKLVSDLACVLSLDELEEMSSKLKMILIDTPIRLCSQSELVNYCSKLSSNIEIGNLNNDILKDEEDNLINGIMSENTNNTVVSKNFKLVSLKDSVEKFGNGYYPEPFNTILLDLISQFEQKYSRKYDNFDRNDLTKLVLIYVPTLEKIIDTNANTPLNSPDKKKAQLDLDINKEMFYFLKHQYKLISIYTLINTRLDDKKEKELAYKCCVNSGDNSNMCYDFGKEQKDSQPVVYGFNDYGYVKDTPCSPESKKELFELQNKTLEIRLLEFKPWNNLSTNIKNRFYKNFKDLLNYFLKTKINDETNINKLSIIYLLGLLKNQNIDLILPDKFEIVENKLNSDNTKVKQIIDTIQISNSFATIKKLVESFGITETYFNFSSLANNIKKLRFAAIKILEIKSLLDTYNPNKSSVELAISRMLALTPTDFKYYDILLKTGISPRYHDDILNNFSKILSDIRLLKVNTITLSKKPKNTITYLEKLFPEGKDMDICSIYKPVLQRLRSTRKITPIEYIYYKGNFSEFCDNRDSLISKDKPILFKDKSGKIVEIYKKNINDVNGKKVTIFTTPNSNNELEIVNLSDDNRVEYTGLLFRNNEIVSIEPYDKDYISVNTITTDDNKNFTVGQANVPLNQYLDEETLNNDEVLSSYSAKEVLDGTTLNTTINDSNKNIVNMINNYFDFEK